MKVLFITPTMLKRIIGILSVVVLAAGVLGADKAKPRKVDFVKEIQPIFEYNCVGCHREGNEKKFSGDYRMDTKKHTFKGTLSKRIQKNSSWRSR